MAIPQWKLMKGDVLLASLTHEDVDQPFYFLSLRTNSRLRGVCTLLRRQIALGLDFARAAEVFSGLTATVVDGRFDYGETRFITAGHLDGRLVVMVWTQRGEARHIISMRHCHAKEETLWLRRMG